MSWLSTLLAEATGWMEAWGSDQPARPQSAYAAAPATSTLDQPPEAIRGLRYPTVRMLEGMLQGDYRQRKSGYGIELGELREYQPGDEIRRIEWNVTARTGIPHVRLQQEEREVTLWLLMDRSASMLFGTAARTKAQLAVEACTALAAAALQKGDSVGAMVYHGAQAAGGGRRAAIQSTPPGLTVVPPRGTRRHLLALREGLGSEGRPGPLSWAGFLERAAQRFRRRTLVLVASDFLAEPGWEEPLRLLAMRHEVVALWLIDPRERDLPDVGVVEMVDAERGERCWIDTGDAEVRERYRLEAAKRQQQIEATLARLAVELLPLSTDQEPVPALLHFIALKKRARWTSRHQ